MLPGISQILDYLHNDHRYYLGIITGNIKNGAFSKLQHYGIHDFFSFGGYGDNEHHRDGIAREGFLDAAEVLKNGAKRRSMRCHWRYGS